MENEKYILNTAKQIITEEVEKAGYRVERIILFGSRARRIILPRKANIIEVMQKLSDLC